jgi:alkaline phosphatase D
MKTIYYYQTFVGLHDLMSHVQDIDVIIISSIHFGKDKTGQKNIFLNDNIPYDPLFNELWTETEKLSVQGCTIMLMMGGAGLAYKELFSDFDTYYPLLKKLIMEKSWIKGIDLDVEENTSIDNIKMLINRLVRDFSDEFIITMAPVSSTLSTDGSSFAGFNYKELYNSIEGKYIHWFNTQCYYSYTFETYESIIKNGYPPEKVVMGMESGQFDESSFPKALDEIKKIKNKYPDFSGVFDWEYLNAPPNKTDPSQWSRLMKQI